MQVVDEDGSPYAAANAKQFGGADGQNGIADGNFAASQLKHSINGASCCHHPASRWISTPAAIAWVISGY